MIIQVLISGALILGFLKLADKENCLDFFGSVTIYVVPLIAAGVFNFTISYFDLPPLLHFLSTSFYFIFPYFIIGAIGETYTTKKKLLLSAGVFAIATAAEIALFVLANALAAT